MFMCIIQLLMAIGDRLFQRVQFTEQIYGSEMFASPSMSRRSLLTVQSQINIRLAFVRVTLLDLLAQFDDIVHGDALKFQFIQNVLQTVRTSYIIERVAARRITLHFF